MSLLNWLVGIALSRWVPRQARGTRSLSRSKHYRPWFESLEDRLVPAVNITVIAGGGGSLDHFLSATNGTITTADAPDAATATLSQAALARVDAEVPISIAASNSITFNNLGTLHLRTDADADASFTTDTGTITFVTVGNSVVTGGGSLTFSAGTNLTVANLNTRGGDVSLTAGTNGAGDVTFANIGTAGSGDVTIQATNAAGGSITQLGARATASGLAIAAAATGDITVNALRGTSVDLASNTGSVSSAGSKSVQASAQLTVSAATGVTLNTLAAALSADNSTSGAIAITQLAAPRQTLDIPGSAGVVNSAAGGSIVLRNLGSGITVQDGDGVQSSNGDITLAAQDLQLDGVVNSGLAVTNLSNSTAGRTIDLGANRPGTIGLTQAELDNVTAGVLRIGGSTAGNINISRAIANPYGWNTLALISGGSITEAAAGSLTIPNLRVSAAGTAFLLSANNISIVAADTAGSFSFNNGTNSMAVGLVDGDTGIVTNGGDVYLIADTMDIAQQVTTGSNTAGVVNLEPFTSNLTINLGTNTFGELGLTTPDLNEITAGVLRIGSSGFSGDITVSAPIDPPTIGALSLVTTSGGGISQGSGDTITVASGNGGLAIQAQTSVALNEQNDVAILAAAITGDFSFTNVKVVTTTAAVDGVSGVTASGTVTIMD